MSLPIVTLAGLSIPKPEKLECYTVDGEVTAFWQHPVGAPSNFHYNVQMAKYVPHQRSSTKCNCEFSFGSVGTRDYFIFFIFVVVTRHDEQWAVVQSCTGITETYCELSGLIQNYRTSYKVKVQLVAGVRESGWAIKRFLPNFSKNFGTSLI